MYGNGYLPMQGTNIPLCVRHGVFPLFILFGVDDFMRRLSREGGRSALAIMEISITHEWSASVMDYLKRT